MDNEEVKSGNPYWLLLSIPIFFGAWSISNFAYALIAGLGSLTLIFTIFVWLPDDKARKINRKIKFAEGRKFITIIKSQIDKVIDSKIVKEIQKALLEEVGESDSTNSAQA